MSEIILPILLIVLIVYAFFKKAKPFNSFANGAKTAFDLALTIFPFLVAIFMMIKICEVSGLLELIANFIAPALNLIGIPKELSMIVVLRPFSANGCFALLNDIFLKYGVDSYIARAACVIVCSSDTLMYLTALYLSKCKVKRLLWTLPIGFAVSLFSGIISCLVCRFI